LIIFCILVEFESILFQFSTKSLLDETLLKEFARIWMISLYLFLYSWVDKSSNFLD
jgi:hypothetical protein